MYHLWRYVCVPEELRSQILNLLHDQHSGASGMKAVAWRCFWWSGINGELECCMSTSTLCQHTNSGTSSIETLWFGSVVQNGSRPSPDLLAKILDVSTQPFLCNTTFYFPNPLFCYGTVHQLFIDFKIAYDSVRRKALHNILIEFRIPRKLVGLIKNVFKWNLQ
jgi:hypothetical protein